MNFLRPLILAAGFLVLWQILVTLTGAPPYILPGPLPVGEALVEKFPLLLSHLSTTLAEILLGLALGTI
ncbi:MAG: ABC transporter permease, partial [Deltaproteobacteria bacterium HGW-Deltaproteobacteria-20]